jgi:hypothetical protein
MLIASNPEFREELASRLREYIPTHRDVLADEEVSPSATKTPSTARHWSNSRGKLSAARRNCPPPEQII